MMVKTLPVTWRRIILPEDKTEIKVWASDNKKLTATQLVTFHQIISIPSMIDFSLKKVPKPMQYPLY